MEMSLILGSSGSRRGRAGAFPVTLEDVTYRLGVGSLSAQSLFDGIFEFFLSKGAQKFLELAGCLSKGQATFCDLLEQFF